MCNIENLYMRWIGENWETNSRNFFYEIGFWQYLYKILIAYFFSNISKVLTCINNEGVWNPIFCLSVILLSGKLCSGYILKQNCQIAGLRYICVFWNNLIKHFSSTCLESLCAPFYLNLIYNILCYIHYWWMRIFCLSSHSFFLFKGIFCAYQLKYQI